MVWIQVRTNILSVLISVQTVCKDYQQTTKVAASMERVNRMENSNKHLYNNFLKSHWVCCDLHSRTLELQYPTLGVQSLSGSVLDSRQRGGRFEPHRRHCVVSLSKNINTSLVLVQPRKTPGSTQEDPFLYN